MKLVKFYVTMFIIFSSLSVRSQTFELADLKKFNDMTLEDFKTCIKTVHHFTYNDKTESEQFILFEYDSPDFKQKIGKFQYKDSSLNCIEYSTKDKVEFERLKSDIIKIGFKVTTIREKYGETYSDYKKDNLLVRLITPNSNERNSEFYEIIVYK